MPVPCPGTEVYNHIFGVGRDGPTPWGAFFKALLVLVFEIGTSRGLRVFLNKPCKAPCDKVLTGPTFTNFTIRIVPKPGGIFHCVMGGNIQAQIDCQKVEAVAINISDREILEGLLKELRHVDKA